MVAILDIIFFAIFGLIIVIIMILIFYLIERAERKRIEQINYELELFLFDSLELTPTEFEDLRTQKKGRRNGRGYISTNYNIPGVYILYNQTRDMYYVGQGKKVLDRVNNHFSGRGNGDVYADYIYGSHFTIKIVPLKNTNYINLNDLEREYIRLFDAKNNGYNKTRGNK